MKRALMILTLVGALTAALSACASRPDPDCGRPAEPAPIDGGVGGTGVSSDC